MVSTRQCAHGPPSYASSRLISYNSIMTCDIGLQFLRNIIITGGTTMLPGFAERMSKEMQALASADIWVMIHSMTSLSIILTHGPCKVKTTAPAERMHSAWIGGSILASLTAFRDSLYTKEEYAEYGTAAIHNS